MAASKEDKQQQIQTVAALPLAKSKAAAMKAGGYAPSTVRHQTKRTFQRLSKSGFCETLEAHGVDEQRVARKLRELLDCGDPRAALGVIRLWLELHDLVNRDQARVINVVVVAMKTVVDECVDPEQRGHAMKLFGDTLGKH